MENIHKQSAYIKLLAPLNLGYSLMKYFVDTVDRFHEKKLKKYLLIITSLKLMCDDISIDI